MASVAFQGFRPELIEFLKDLEANNSQPLSAHQVFDAQLRRLCLAQYARLAPRQQWPVEVLPD